MRRRGLLGLLVLAVVLTTGVGVMLWQAVELFSVSKVSIQVEQIKPFAGGVRLAIIGLVAALWPKLVYLDYYHSWRLYRILEQDALDGRPVRTAEPSNVVEVPAVNGLHYVYHPKAA